MTVTNLVAIAGGTCAGKTELSQSLVAAAQSDIAVLSQDSFYPDRSAWNYSDLAKFNWDDLNSFDHARIDSCLCKLLSNQSVSVPKYNRVTHAIEWDEAKTIMPTSVLIFEGLHAIELARACLQRARTDTVRLIAVFIECEMLERRYRRIRRESIAKTVPGDFSKFWAERCEPTFQAQVLPQRALADLIIRSPWTGRALAELVATVVQRV